MTEQRRLATEQIRERLDQLNQEVLDLEQAERQAAIGAVALSDNVHTANIQALIDVVRVLGAEIDQLRADITSSQS